MQYNFQIHDFLTCTITKALVLFPNATEHEHLSRTAMGGNHKAQVTKADSGLSLMQHTSTHIVFGEIYNTKESSQMNLKDL